MFLVIVRNAFYTTTTSPLVYVYLDHLITRILPVIQKAMS